MVKLTQVDDAQASSQATEPKQQQQFQEETDSESESEVDDDFDIENETLYERVLALKDIIPPKQRTQIVSVADTLKSQVTLGLNKGGNLLWTLTSSALLLGVPLSLAILAETQLQEMEKEMSLQQSAQDVLTSNSQDEKDKQN